jgi:hypothetical protein
MDQIITLEVEGQIFKIDKDTLLKIPYFVNLYETAPPKYDEIIKIYRSARAFSHILQCARSLNKSYKFPIKYIEDYNYFLMEGYTFYDPIAEIQSAKNELSREIRLVNDGLRREISDLCRKINSINTSNIPNQPRKPWGPSFDPIIDSQVHPNASWKPDKYWPPRNDLIHPVHPTFPNGERPWKKSDDDYLDFM